ncbi:hypothetical protein BDW02DRAFT_632355 [Decorospora gaudefroyi]|uniref:TLC domain-containing protein n=1 Tax=Decorospora gaudefroyi TaxID=184978 RepID=A0A6A5K6N6_9PLEO|nr:hypothetical protein BDW02DRAFT_632355 [Decorospora gaudefroyi]
MADLQNMRSDYTLRNKGLSAAHATATSLAAFFLLRYASWPLPEAAEAAPEPAKHVRQHLDDSRNPTISGRNYLANALTAWETAYLLYDTYAMVYVSRRQNKLSTTGTSAALRQVAKDSPVAMAHHVLLASAFLVLQAYIAAVPP